MKDILSIRPNCLGIQARSPPIVYRSIPKIEFSSMNSEWSENENQIIVSSYLDMLDQELKRQKYDKSAVKEVLLQKLPNRNSSSIDYKLRNISSVLEDSGFPFIQGYKPAKHYQASLKEVVSTLIFHRAFSTTGRK